MVHRYKGTRELVDNNKYEMFKEGDKYVLIVHDVFGEDADEYSVKASNRAGTRSSRADLAIKCKITASLSSPGAHPGLLKGGGILGRHYSTNKKVGSWRRSNVGPNVKKPIVDQKAGSGPPGPPSPGSTHALQRLSSSKILHILYTYTVSK